MPGKRSILNANKIFHTPEHLVILCECCEPPRGGLFLDLPGSCIIYRNGCLPLINKHFPAETDEYTVSIKDDLFWIHKDLIERVVCRMCNASFVDTKFLVQLDSAYRLGGAKAALDFSNGFFNK